MTKKTHPKPGTETQASTKKSQPPWVQIAHRTERFLTDLNSLKELFLLVAPVLANKDEQRQKELTQAAKDLGLIAKKMSKTRGRKRASDFYDLLARATEVKQLVLRLKRADSMFRSNSLSSLTTCFENYEADMIRIILTAFPARLKSPDKTISYEEALRLGSSDEIKAALISVEVDKVMRQSQREQFKYLEGVVNYKFRENLPEWPAYVEVTERRNIHTHCAGKASKQYLEVCQAEKAALDDKLAIDTQLPVTDEYFVGAINLFFEVGVKLADITLRRLFPEQLKQADDMLLEIGLNCEKSDDWELSFCVFEYGTKLPAKTVSSEAFQKLFLINKAICLKAKGCVKDCNTLLDSVDWSASDPKYLLAAQILKEQYSDAEKTFSRFNKKGPILEQNCRDWPLFRDFRKSQEFKRAFKRVFGKDFDEVPASAIRPPSPLAVVQSELKTKQTTEASNPELSDQIQTGSGQGKEPQAL